jgi:hypothetical protein
MKEETLSGLDESSIESADLTALQAAFAMRSLDPSIRAAMHRLDPALLDGAAPALQIRSVDLSIRPRRSAGQTLLAVLGKTTMHRLKVPVSRPGFRHHLPAACLLPVLRRRMFTDEISKEAAASLFSQIYEKYEELAGTLDVLALFRNVPPECAGSIVLDEKLQQLSFLPDSGGKNSQKYTYGYYLAVLRDASGKLRRLLLRLE